MERRIRSLVRWNAMAMVMRTNLKDPDLGGHISSFASSATLYDIGFNYFFQAPTEALEGQEKGFQGTLVLQPEDAFGVRDENLVTTIAKRDFPPGVKVGGQLEGTDAEGKQQVFTVQKIKGDTVYLDGNHPLAGEVLHFAVKVVDVQAASAEEIAHGHAHGAHGHHH
jgi:FKBP-type peptidyl-prolyl cis-trans isomerase SlyD